MTDKIVLARFEGGYRGIYARENIFKGEEIIEGNSDAIIDIEVATEKFKVIYFLRQAWANDENLHLTDNLNLVLYILLSTRFQPTLYTRSLPETGIHGPKPVGPGPSGSVLVLRPNRTRTENIFKTWDRTGPGPRKISKSRTGLDQNQQNFESL